MKMKTLVLAASVVSVGIVGTANAAFVDIDISGWQTWAGLYHPANSSTVVNIGAGSEITSIQFIDLQFQAMNGSWQSELILSVERNDGSAWFDWRPASGINSSGIFGPVSGAFGAGPGASAGGGLFIANDGLLFIHVYESFDDGGAAVQDAQIFSGIIRITYSPIPAPGALALLGMAGFVGVRRRRA